MTHRLPHHISLRLSLLLYIVLPLGGVMALSGYLALGALERHMEERMQNDLELVARAIRLPISHALERDRGGSVSQALESAFRIGHVYSAYVYDKHGEQIAAAGEQDPAPQQRHLTRLAASGERQGEYGEVAGRDVYSYFVPLTDSGGRINGLLQLTRRHSDFQYYVQSLRMWSVSGLLISMLVMTGLVYYGHHRALGIHFQRLIASMERISKGDWWHRSLVQGPREISMLATSFNNMLDSIDDAQQEIEHRRRSEQQLQQKLRQSEKLAAIGQLAAGIAHELGTPLSVVDGKAQRSLRQRDLSSDVQDSLQSIRDEVRRMEHIVYQLLDFSSNNLQYQSCQASVLASNAASSLEDKRRQLGVQLHVSGPDDASFSADHVRIEQVLVNLLSNAMEAAQGGKVILEWKVLPGEIQFVVDDTGHGIDSSLEHRIFEPFFTTKAVGQGTGLGLAVVHGIVQEHGGRIETAQSQLGGACFRVTLPRQAVQEEYNVQV
ncbi:sensor histidine kinase [Desulfurispira natronophila]|uniref:histidine kinase n=1 Tax=Desulfurispira natronophila TaxID=682562 RepID=A0A7W7Y5I6_9BACT|nr:ATP-binding protein [Desulfurispira natronophila]MBB5022463.1 signal transduction histidine kinase [Desulfurispira natronophila]